MEKLDLEKFNTVKRTNFGKEVSALIEEIKTHINDKADIRIPTWQESQDIKLVYNKYQEAVNRYSYIMDLIKRSELEIGIIKHAISQLDLNTTAGIQFKKQFTAIQNTLQNYMESLYSSRQQVDRVVRFYEKTANGSTVF